MNKNYNTKNKFLKSIALGSFLLGSFAATSSQLQAGPLHEAVFSGSMTETHRLLRAGENPNETDKYGYLPLQYAATPEMTDLLLNGRADINMPNAWGDTTLRRAVSTHYPNLAHIKQLLQRGAKKD
ncbi:MAG: ankyrin repeat domain-containing protein, partial [Bacteroidales bacterium]|nr:ankyrin repeat domain-containing protein [Bacteroidales bacterium]